MMNLRDRAITIAATLVIVMSAAAIGQPYYDQAVVANAAQEIAKKGIVIYSNARAWISIGYDRPVAGIRNFCMVTNRAMVNQANQDARLQSGGGPIGEQIAMIKGLYPEPLTADDIEVCRTAGLPLVTAAPGPALRTPLYDYDIFMSTGTLKPRMGKDTAGNPMELTTPISRQCFAQYGKHAEPDVFITYDPTPNAAGLSERALAHCKLEPRAGE